MTSKVERSRRGAFGSVLLPLFACVLVLAQAREASAQWTAPDAQGNITTTNAGHVGIGAPPYNPEGWAKVLDVYGSPHARFTVRTSTIDGRFMSHDHGWWGAPAGMFLGTRTGHPLTFATGDTFRMIIAAGGNVGIGTASPAQKLDVQGSVVASERFGVGTAQPAERLDVRGNFILDAGTSPALFTGTGGAELNRYLNLLNSPGLTSASGLKAGGVLVSDDYGYANPAKNDLVVKGRIGIGTGAPAYKLDVAGAIRSAAGGFVFPDGSVQTTASGATSTLNAASVSSGTFGSGTGVGNYGFPASVTMNGTLHSIIDTGAHNRFRICGPNGGCSLAGEYIGGRLKLSKDGSFVNAEAQVDPGMGGINAPGNAYVGGNVGIGTTAPASKLHVAGDIRVDGNITAKYQDVAEWVPSHTQLAAGTVVVVDAGGVNRVLASTAAYDTSVAGVISAQPGIALGEAGEGKVLVATTGRVKVRVDATRLPVRAGDLLVTSDREGYAMKSEPVMVGNRKIHSPGTIVGKALESLDKGTGEILVLLSLQ